MPNEMEDLLLKYDFTDRGGNAVYQVFRLSSEVVKVGTLRLAYEDDSVVSLTWDDDNDES